MGFKKIASVLASAAMVFSTVGFAAATTYPAPFVSGGVADVAIVYGSHPAANDMVGVVNIQNSLNSFVVASSVSTPLSADCEGETCVKLDSSSNHINLRDDLNDAFGSTIDDGDLTTYLVDGTYTAEDSDTFDYEQSITLGSPVLSHFRDSDYEDAAGLGEKTPTIGFNMTSNNFVMNYTLDFLDQAISSVTSGDLDDFEGSTINLLGKSYYISDAKNGTSTTYFGKWTLLDTANTALVSEGETTTLDVGDVTYEVSAQIFSATQVILTVNGERTNTLNEGETQKLTGTTTYVGIKDILYVSKDTGVSSVEFSIGNGKIEITSASDIQINGDTVDGVKGYIHRGTASGSDEKLDKIALEWKTYDDEFITPELPLTLPGLESAKFDFANWVRSTEEKVDIGNDGDSIVELGVVVADGTYNLPILYANSSGEFTGIGKDANNRLVTAAATTLTFFEQKDGSDYDEYLVASYNTSTESESYILSFKVNEDTTNGRNETTVKNLVTGESWDERVEGNTFKMSGGKVQFTVNDINYTSQNRSVTITAGTNVNFQSLFTEGGLKIDLPYYLANVSTTGLRGAVNLSIQGTVEEVSTAGHDEDTFYLFMRGEDKDDNKASGTSFNITVNDNTDGELLITHVNHAGSGGADGKEIGTSKVYEAYIRDDVAPRVLHYTDPTQDYIEVYYPTGDSESYAEVFFSAVGASIGGGEGSIGAPILDTEIAQASGKNLVVVGGSCVNTVAAELLRTGSERFCGTDWTAATGIGADTFLIQTFARTDGNVATLVAGWGAVDTQNAATALTTQTVDTTAGKKYTGTTAESIESIVA